MMEIGVLVAVLNFGPLPPEGDYKIVVQTYILLGKDEKGPRSGFWDLKVPAGSKPSDARDILRAAMVKSGWVAENGVTRRTPR